MYESKDKLVSHPAHYQSETGLEVIDWKNKNGIQDLEKIMWYTQHLIDHLRKLEKENN